MTSVNNKLFSIINNIQRPTDFYVSDFLEIYTPRIVVEGFGPLSFPLLAIQAEQLIATAESAPYGKGEQTLIDPKVRRTWQVNKDQIRAGGKNHPK